MYSYIDLTATVLNCRLPTTWHINYIRLSWCGSLIKLLRLQLMVCFTQISRKTETGKNRNRGFLCKTEPKPNRKWNRRTVTALLFYFAIEWIECDKCWFSWIDDVNLLLISELIKLMLKHICVCLIIMSVILAKLNCTAATCFCIEVMFVSK